MTPTDVTPMAIDFGTTNSVMAWFNARTGAVEVIRNAEHEEATPSVVYYDDEETLTGRAALDLLESAPPTERDQALGRTVSSIKRRLGARQLIPLPDGRDLEPVDVVVDILGKLRRDAEASDFGYAFFSYRRCQAWAQ